ncbi:MAG: hypothetical protein EBT03_12905, partial [Betaproteobacteria bacterium]|nr:hypothetical protein [Betaproteobacteria bacterium]
VSTQVLLADEDYRALLLADTRRWMIHRGYERVRGEGQFATLNSLSTSERAVLWEQLRWELAGVFSQRNILFSTRSLREHVIEIIDLVRYFKPECFDEVVEDLHSVGLAPEPAKLRLPRASEVSPHFCVVPFRYLDENASGFAEVCRYLRPDTAVDGASIRQAMISGRSSPGCADCLSAEALCGISPRTDANQLRPAGEVFLGAADYLPDTLRRRKSAPIGAVPRDARPLRTWILRDDEQIFQNGHLEELGGLIASGLSEKMELVYGTRLLRDPGAHLPIWSNFGGIKLEVTLRGVGERFDYREHPFKWTEWTRRMEQVLEFSTRTRVYLMIELDLLNAWHGSEFIEFLKGFKGCRLHACFRADLKSDLLGLQRTPPWARGQLISNLQRLRNEMGAERIGGLDEVIRVLDG